MSTSQPFAEQLGKLSLSLFNSGYNTHEISKKLHFPEGLICDAIYEERLRARVERQEKSNGQNVVRLPNIPAERVRRRADSPAQGR